MANFELSIAVEILLYAPPRPLVDFSVAFLWLMSVGTIVCASLWSDLTTPEKSDERYNELCPKVFPCDPIVYLYVIKRDPHFLVSFISFVVATDNFIRVSLFQVFAKLFLEMS